MNEGLFVLSTYDKITDVKITLTPNHKKNKATAQIILNDAIQLNGLRVIESITADDFIGYPFDVNSKEYKDVFYPLISELREVIECAVLAEYKKCIKQ